MQTLLRMAIAIGLAGLLAGREAAACSVPVFRYALERWPADLFEVDVFHRGPLSEEQRAIISRLEDQSLVNGGDRNWEIVDCDLAKELDDDLQTVWQGLSDSRLPSVVVRCPGGRQGSPLVWSGPINKVESAINASTAERELVRRLLAGDAVVWLVLRGSDEEQADRVTKLIAEQIPRLTQEIELPGGVGLPGSELLARIPLEVRFSLLDVKVNEARNTSLRRTAVTRLADEVDDSTTLVVPVFGRGRAAHVLTAEDLDADGVEEWSRFLCGACSCQVKQANPGFDLLLPAAWDARLYGEDVPPEAVADTTVAAVEPTYVAIPVGESAATQSMTARPETPADLAVTKAAEAMAAKDAAKAESPEKRETDWPLIGACVLMVGGLYAWRRQAAWKRRNALEQPR